MANTLTPIIPKVLARALMALRQQSVMPRMVNSDYSAEAAKKNSTIDVPIPSAVVVTDVVPSNIKPTPADQSPSIVQISLDQWKQAAFQLSDNDMMRINKDEAFMPMEMSEAVEALARNVNSYLHSTYKGVYGFSGTAGTTPFATDVSGATNSRKVLNQQRALKSNRRGVLDFDADANALALAPFADADKTMSNTVKIEGDIGRKYGIDWVADDAVTTHIAGTAVATTVAAAGALLGAVSVLMRDAGGNTLVEGDIITFAGDSQTYVVGADVTVAAAADTAVAIQPPLAIALGGAEVVTKKATHVVNLIFHRDAIAYASRPLLQTMVASAQGNMMSMTDPVTGINLRLEVTRQHKQDVWELDILFGGKLVRAALATRLAG